MRVSITENFADVWKQHYFNLFNCVQNYKVGIIEGNDPIVIFTLGVSVYKQAIASGLDHISVEHLKR